MKCLPYSVAKKGAMNFDKADSPRPKNSPYNLKDVLRKAKLLMSGFTNADGSTLVGGQKTGTNQGQALQVDTAGNLLVNVAIGGGGGGGGSTVNIADPTTPTNKLAVDSSGKIGVNNFPATQPVSGTVSVGNFPATQPVSGTISVGNFPATQSINLSQVNGAAHSVNNPVITEDQFRAWMLNGQGFSATTGKLTAGSAITGGISVFNPNASGKTLVLLSLSYIIGNNSFNQVNLTTSDPALGTSVSATNNKAGSATASVTSCSSANTTVTPAGTLCMSIGSASNTYTQVLTNGNLLIVPPNNGIAFYSNLSGTNSWAATLTWIEI